MKLRNLLLNLLHDLNLALKKFCNSAHGVVFALSDLSVVEGKPSLLDFVDQILGYFLLGSGDNEVQKLLVGHNTLVVVSHQIYQKVALLFSQLGLDRSWV